MSGFGAGRARASDLGEKKPPGDEPSGFGSSLLS
jgi:hypothetical protein